MQRPMVRLYDLRDQADLIAAMQRTSLEDSDMGLAPDPLVGSDGWWAQVGTPDRPLHRIVGTVTRAYWGSMADWPEFEVSDPDGVLSTWTAEGDRRRLVPGLHARVEYVEHPRKPGSRHDFEESDSRVVIGIWVQDSPRRIDGAAPGPGGAGYELDRRFGEAVHYLRVPSRAAGERVLTELERQGRVGRVWGGGTAELWYASIWAPSEEDARSEIAILDRLARTHGGSYDGGEVIDGAVWGPDLDDVEST
jgi:hypothetical protein